MSPIGLGSCFSPAAGWILHSLQTVWSVRVRRSPLIGGRRTGRLMGIQLSGGAFGALDPALNIQKTADVTQGGTQGSWLRLGKIGPRYVTELFQPDAHDGSEPGRLPQGGRYASGALRNRVAPNRIGSGIGPDEIRENRTG